MRGKKGHDILVIVAVFFGGGGISGLGGGNGGRLGKIEDLGGVGFEFGEISGWACELVHAVESEVEVVPGLLGMVEASVANGQVKVLVRDAAIVDLNRFFKGDDGLLIILGEKLSVPQCAPPACGVRIDFDGFFEEFGGERKIVMSGNPLREEPGGSAIHRTVFGSYREKLTGEFIGFFLVVLREIEREGAGIDGNELIGIGIGVGGGQIGEKLGERFLEEGI